MSTQPIILTESVHTIKFAITVERDAGRTIYEIWPKKKLFLIFYKLFPRAHRFISATGLISGPCFYICDLRNDENRHRTIGNY